MPNTPLQGLPYPPFTGVLPNGSQQMLDALVAVEKQLVMKFANAATRDAVVTAPVAGMVAWLTATSQWTGYNGTRWVPLSYHIESGVLSHAYGGGLGPVWSVITFAYPYAVAPAVTIGCNATQLQTYYGGLSATSVSIFTKGFNGVAPPSGDYSVSWMAIGLV